MHAVLYRAAGKTRLTIGEREPAALDGEVVSSAEIEFDPADIFEFLTEQAVGGEPEPTLEELTNDFDPSLAWYGGSSEGSHAVLYGQRGDYDRKVSFRRTDGEYAVTLQLGTVEDVPAHAFRPADVQPVVVRSTSLLHAKRTFYDFCAVD